MFQTTTSIKRYPNNPILGPDSGHPWEAQAVFNGCPVKDEDGYHLFYRALSHGMHHNDITMDVSSIGYTHSDDGINFSGERRQLIAPDKPWDIYGCEDPRVTKIDDTYYIIYTALSDYPHTPAGITIGVATTKDLRNIDIKHQVTHFNSKAMALFPEKINGKYVAILTVDTDILPVRIAIAEFDTIEQLWDRDYWTDWYDNIDDHTLHIQRNLDDHVEVGAPPVATDDGWLLIYSYIHNYKSSQPVFSVEAMLLENQNPLKIIGHSRHSLISPQEVYERYGIVPNITFPSGVLIEGDRVRLYYGGADTVCCIADLSWAELSYELLAKGYKKWCATGDEQVAFKRFVGNPIIEPNRNHAWESKYTLNPTAFIDNGQVHILYRAQDNNDTSVIGYATSTDGIHLDQQYDEPIYIPRIPEEIRIEPGNSGCEDARATVIDDSLYLCYTAYNGHGPARVALTSISLTDFRAHNWDKWSMPQLISPESMDDKNSCLVSEKINGKYAFFHRLNHAIWLDFVDTLNFANERKLGGKVLMEVRPDSWDSRKIGIAGPPIKVGDEWLLIYHALSLHDGKYRLGAALLDLENERVTARLDYPILEPEAEYENRGLRPGTVFSCGAVVIDDQIHTYYGGADQFVCVATINLPCLMTALHNS